MAGFNAHLEPGRIARGGRCGQSKKLMWAIKGIYSSQSEFPVAAALKSVRFLLQFQ